MGKFKIPNFKDVAVVSRPRGTAASTDEAIRSGIKLVAALATT